MADASSACPLYGRTTPKMSKRRGSGAGLPVISAGISWTSIGASSTPRTTTRPSALHYRKLCAIIISPKDVEDILTCTQDWITVKPQIYRLVVVQVEEQLCSCN